MLDESTLTSSALPEIPLDLIAEIVRELELLSISTKTTEESELRPVDSFRRLQVTAWMVRNIPVHLKQREVLEMFLKKFPDSINFFYMPTDISKSLRHGLGFCFINLATPEDAAAFRKFFSGRSLCRDGFPLTFSKAAVQGLEANITNVRQSPAVRRIKNPDYMPLIKLNKRFVPVASLLANQVL